MNKILLVEDDRISLEYLKYVVKSAVSEMYEINTAINGADGLDMVRRHNYKLVITDIMMPVMDGVEMLRIIKKEKPYIPVIVVTAMKDLSYAAKSIKHGAEACLHKPVIKEELIQTLFYCIKMEYKPSFIRRLLTKLANMF